MVVSHFSHEKWCLSRTDLVSSRILVLLEDLLVIVDPSGGPFLFVFDFYRFLCTGVARGCTPASSCILIMDRMTALCSSPAVS